MLPNFQHVNLITHRDGSCIQWRDLHTQTRILRPLIDNPVTPQRSQRLVLIGYSSFWVDVRQLAPGRPTRDVQVHGGCGIR